MINLNHTIEEVNLIASALRELPHKLVHDLLTKLEKQAVPQIQALQQPTEAASATDTPAEPTA
jgi:hypothetical protein